jgi:cytochrome c553
VKAAGRAILAVSATLAAISAADADPVAGRKLAVEKCQPCHGIDGVALIPEAPNLAGQNRSYLAKQLWAFRSGERSDQKMSPVSTTLSDQDIIDAIDWYSSIRITVTVPQ